MASSRTPLLADDRRPSLDSTYDSDNYNYNNNEETTLFYGLATTSPTRPFATTFHPTLYTRSLALILALPAFIILIAVWGSHYAPAIVFLSFAIARQLVVLGTHFGSQIIVIHVEVVHHRWKGVSARAQEAWIKKITAATVDGVVLVGLLVTLSLVASEIDGNNGAYALPATVTHAVILGFIAFGLLLLSVPDFGNPSLVVTAVAVEKPVAGVLKLATSVVYGEPDEPDSAEVSRKRKPRTPTDDLV